MPKKAKKRTDRIPDEIELSDNVRGEVAELIREPPWEKDKRLGTRWDPYCCYVCREAELTKDAIAVIYGDGLSNICIGCAVKLRAEIERSRALN